MRTHARTPGVKGRDNTDAGNPSERYYGWSAGQAVCPFMTNPLLATPSIVTAVKQRVFLGPSLRFFRLKCYVALLASDLLAVDPAVLFLFLPMSVVVAPLIRDLPGVKAVATPQPYETYEGRPPDDDGFLRSCPWQLLSETGGAAAPVHVADALPRD